MAFFPRSYLSRDDSTSFTPLFRLLDDFDQYSSDRNGGNQQRQGRNALKSFTPRFDVKELGETYELHGELPGIEQKDVVIEFIDDQTLHIRGRTERSFTSGTPPSIEGVKSSGAITQGGEAEHNDKAHQPTVEDAGEDGTGKKAENTEQQVTKAEPQKKSEEPQAKYWVSERSVGEFSRSFSFPVRVDQDGVKASMKNGILSIVVPKAKKQEGRKITIQ